MNTGDTTQAREILLFSYFQATTIKLDKKQKTDILPICTI